MDYIDEDESPWWTDEASPLQPISLAALREPTPEPEDNTPPRRRLPKYDPGLLVLGLCPSLTYCSTSPTPESEAEDNGTSSSQLQALPCSGYELAKAPTSQPSLSRRSKAPLPTAAKPEKLGLKCEKEAQAPSISAVVPIDNQERCREGPLPYWICCACHQSNHLRLCDVRCPVCTHYRCSYCSRPPFIHKHEPLEGETQFAIRNDMDVEALTREEVIQYSKRIKSSPSDSGYGTVGLNTGGREESIASEAPGTRYGSPWSHETAAEIDASAEENSAGLRTSEHREEEMHQNDHQCSSAEADPEDVHESIERVISSISTPNISIAKTNLIDFLLMLTRRANRYLRLTVPATPGSADSASPCDSSGLSVSIATSQSPRCTSSFREKSSAPTGKSTAITCLANEKPDDSSKTTQSISQKSGTDKSTGKRRATKDVDPNVPGSSSGSGSSTKRRKRSGDGEVVGAGLKIHCVFFIGEPDKYTDCTTTYSYISQLQRHLRTQTHNFFACSKCFQRFSSKLELQQHREGHLNPCRKACDQVGCMRHCSYPATQCRHIETTHDQWLALYRVQYPETAAETISQDTIMALDSLQMSHLVPSHLQNHNFESAHGNQDVMSTIFPNVSDSIQQDSAVTQLPMLQNTQDPLERQTVSDLLRKLVPKVALMEQRQLLSTSRKESDLENALIIVWDAFCKTNSPDTLPGSAVYRMLELLAPSVIFSVRTSSTGQTSMQLQQDYRGTHVVPDLLDQTVHDSRRAEDFSFASSTGLEPGMSLDFL